jgi:hypothetical protein
MKAVLLGDLVNQKEFEPLESSVSPSVTMLHTEPLHHEIFYKKCTCLPSSSMDDVACPPLEEPLFFFIF